MCFDSGLGRGTAFVLSGFNPTALLVPPRPPRFKAPKTVDPAEAQRRAEERARLARDRTKGGFGLSDTFVTGPGGVAGRPSAGSGPAPSGKSLVGG